MSKTRLEALLVLISIVAGAVALAQSFPTVDAFKTSTPARKVTALQAISSGRMTMPGSVLDPYIAIAVVDPDARVREHGIAALSWFEARRVVIPQAGETPTAELRHYEPTLRKLLQDDPDARVRSVALSALAYLTMTKPMQLTGDVALLVIDRMTKERDGLARVNAIGLLLNTRSPEVTSALMNALGDTLPPARAKAIEIIGQQHIVSAIPRIVEILAKDLDWFPRWHAARALGRLSPDSRSVIATVEAREKAEPDARVREEIAQALALMRR